MIYFIDFTLLILAALVGFLLIKPASKKDWLFLVASSLVALIFNYVGLALNIHIYFSIFGLAWNILLPLSQTILLVILFCYKHKYSLLGFSIYFFLLDLGLKVLFTLVFKLHFAELNSNDYYYFTTYFWLANLFITLISLVYLYWFKSHLMKSSSPLWLFLTMTIIEIVCFIFINYSLFDTVFAQSTNYYLLVGINIFLLLILLISLYFCYQIFKQVTKQQALIKNYEIKQVENQYQAIYLAKQEELIKIKHDLKNIVATIKTSNSNLLLDLKNKLDKTDGFYYTKNELINAILVNKFNEINMKKIELKPNIALTEKININDYDLISLITNIMDNAIEGTINTPHPSIEFTLSNDDKSFIIFVKNFTNNQELKTKKINKNYHGYGLKIIKEICHKYHATLDIQLQKAYYSIYILIPLSN